MPWLYQTPLTRRRFLQSAAIGAAMMFAPKWARSLTPELITTTVEFEAGQTYEDKFYICDPTFAQDTSVQAAAAPSGNGYTLRRVTVDSGFRNWQSRWNALPEVGPPPGVRSSCHGISSRGYSGVTYEGVKVRGFPQTGLHIDGCSDSTFTDVETENCFFGARFDGNGALIQNTTVRRFVAKDVWGPIPDTWNTAAFPSQARAGEYTGRDGLVVNTTRNCLFEDCTVVGETGNGAFKFGTSKNLTLRGLVGPNLQIQGSGGADPANSPQTASRDILMEFCTIDKTTGYGSSNFDINALQLSYHVENLRVRGCLFRTVDTNGHGCQLAQPNVEAYFEGCTFSGFNLLRGAQDAYAVHRNPTCWLNGGGTAGDADFIARNSFPKQLRKVLVA